MKQIVYIRKEIKTAEDLPEENGWYFVHCKNELVEGITTTYWNGSTLWSDIDWYLQPLEIELPDDAKIKEYFEQWTNPRIKIADEEYERWLNGYQDELIDSAVRGAIWLRDKIKSQLK